MLALTPGQCVLTTDSQVFETHAGPEHAGQHLFIGNFYLRATSNSVSPSGFDYLVVLSHEGGAAWLHNVTFQGTLSECGGPARYQPADNFGAALL
jgi:hypothetical protein